jgi:site-specific DNA recombinase
MSKQDVASNLWCVLHSLAESSYEFADFLRRVFPKFEVRPVQALDSGLVRPRAWLTFRPSRLANASQTGQEAEEGFELVLDLFEPPVHIRHMEACLAERQAHPKLSLKKLAARLDIGYMTVKRAFDYARRMEAEGLTEPYRELDACPAEASHWRTRLKAS